MGLPAISEAEPAKLLGLFLFRYIIEIVFGLFCQFFDIATDEVDPWAVDNVMGVSIAGDALVHVFSVLADHCMLHMHELEVLAAVFSHGREEAFLL